MAAWVYCVTYMKAPPPRRVDVPHGSLGVLCNIHEGPSSMGVDVPHIHFSTQLIQGQTWNIRYPWIWML